MADEIAQSIVKRFDTAVSSRGNFEGQWQEIARRILPGYADTFSHVGDKNQGEKQTEEMIDATAAVALPRFASVMESMLTPRDTKWHRLAAGDKILKRNKLVQEWFEDVRDILFKHRYAAAANFASQQFESYMSLGAFGTGSVFVDKRDGGGMRYRSIHLAEIYFLENHQGIIDTALRKFELTARQALQMFGLDNLPEKIRDAAADNTKQDSAKFKFIHCVKPRANRDPDRKDVRGMVFASHYVSVEEKVTVREGGYNTFPYAISRYVTAPGETYGRSPAMLALPTIKLLNEQKKTMLKQGHRTVDPVLLAHDDGVLDAFSLRPGAINYGGVNAEGRLMVQPLPIGNVGWAKEMMQEERAIINDVFLISLFQILVDNPQMTATEVLERAREKGMLLGPTMGRQQSEALGPMIDRELDVLAAQGLLPPMPPILAAAEGEYDVVYDSPMSRAQKAEEAAGLFRTIDWVREYVNITQDPTPLDHINWDVAMPEVLEIQAVPTRWVRGADEIMKLRDGRAQQAQIQTAIEAAPAAAGMIKAMPQGAPA